MRNYSLKRCSGCGVEKRIAPNTVCHECSTAIHEYPKAKAALANADTSNLREYLIGERAGIPGVIYKFDSAPDFAKALSDLLRCVGHATKNEEPQSFHNPRRLTYSKSNVSGALECEHRDMDRQDYRIHLPRDVDEHLHSLFDAVRAVVTEATKKGQSKGQNLLFQLNSGAISIDEFNASATGIRR